MSRDQSPSIHKVELVIDMSIQKDKQNEKGAQFNLRRFLCRDKSGSSLVEVLLLIGVFALISVGVISTLLTSSHAAKQGMEFVVAAGYIEEGIQAVRSIRDQDYTLLTNGTYGLSTASGYYEFFGGSQSLGGGDYTRTITIEDVYRASGLSGDIALSGVLDENTKKVTVNLVWDVFEGRGENIDAVFYVMNWGVLAWLQTLDTDFSAGSQNSTAVTAILNGEMVLQSADADWDGITSLYEVDLDGTGDRIALFYVASQDILYALSESTSGNEFQALDVSNLSNQAPSELRGYDLSGVTATDFVISGDYAYLSSNGNSEEVTVIRLSDMSYVQSVNISGNEDAEAIAIEGSVLAVCTDNAGSEEVYFYDISSPESTLVEIGTTEISENCADIALTSTHAFVGTNDNSTELIVIQLSDYSEVSSVNMSGNDNVYSVELVGDNLYVGRDDGSSYDFALFDISSPTSIPSPTTLELGVDVYASAIDPREEFAALASNNNSQEVLLVELSSFTLDESVNVDGNDNGNAVEIFGGYLFLGSDADSEDLEIFSSGVSGWSVPSLISSTNKSGTQNVSEIDIGGDYAYFVTTNSSDELYIYDISTPSSPTYLGSIDIGGTVYGIDVEGSYAYLATSHNSRELDIIDISTKTSPVRVGSLNLSRGNNAYDVVVDGGYAYLVRDSGRDEEFFVIDISTPSSPFEVGAYEAGFDINKVVVDGGYAYAATDSNSYELAVFDISTPASPSFAGGYNLSGNDNAEAIAFAGTLAAIGRSGGDQLAFLDVSLPSSPSFFSEINIGSTVNDIVFDGTDAVFIGVDGNNVELQRWDVSDPVSPILVFAQDCDADVQGVSYDGTNVYAGTEHDSEELQVYGAAIGASDYAAEGTVTSQAFDSTSSTTNWSTISWGSSGVGGIEFRIRTADSEGNLDAARWVGSDGTEDTAYTVEGESVVVDPMAAGTQWIQWKAYLSGDRLDSPILEDVTIVY
jgi:type II secretory pathway pseudopilin PulG